MNDKELLELAAKAGGIVYEPRYKEPAGVTLRGLLQSTGIANAPLKWWNPLTDDGDALRLAVRLRLMFYMFCYEISGKPAAAHAGVNTYEGERVNVEVNVDSVDGDPYAATRRAIVRAAAEIGKAMP